jgi:hypothetical protein
MSTENQSAIDEKKSEDEGTNKNVDWRGFLKNLGHGLITGILIGVVCVGSVGLFLAKAANANVFPTEINMQPYEDIKRDLDIEVIYMNPVKILPYFGLGFWADPEKYYIQEANFFNSKADINFMDKFFNTWLCSLQKKDTFFFIFETDVLKSMMRMSFAVISGVFFYMNYLPEWLTMLVFSMFFAIILIGIYVSNIIYGIYAHVVKYVELISFLLKPNDDEDTLLLDYPGIIMYSVLYFWAAIISVIISPALITIYTLFKALSVNYIVRKKDKIDEPPQKMNLISFIKNVFYYKKTFIIILSVLKLMSSTNSYLGSSYMIGLIIAILILIFGLNILIPDDPDDSLFSVLNPNFPTLEQQEPKSGNFIDICNSKVDTNKVVSNTNPKSSINISIVTKQPVDVLEAVIPEKENKKIIGGGGKRKDSMTKSKQKIYNLKLV